MEQEGQHPLTGQRAANFMLFYLYNNGQFSKYNVMSSSSVKVSKFGLVTYLLIVTLSVSSDSVAHRLLGLPSIFDDHKIVHNETL